jgi:hypothetical protein
LAFQLKRITQRRIVSKKPDAMAAVSFLIERFVPKKAII